MKCAHGFPPELQAYCPVCTRQRDVLTPPAHVKAQRQSIEFWHYTLPGKVGAALERLEADNNIATALALQRIKDMADWARLRLEYWPYTFLGDAEHATRRLQAGMVALEYAVDQAGQNIYAMRRALGGQDNAADWGG